MPKKYESNCNFAKHTANFPSKFKLFSEISRFIDQIQLFSNFHLMSEFVQNLNLKTKVQGFESC